jgi:hypothetical protein
MQRSARVPSIFIAVSLMVLSGAPALAVSAKQKMETCKFGADHPMLAGKQRADFMKKCMSEKDDPRGPSPSAPGAEGKPN